MAETPEVDEAAVVAETVEPTACEPVAEAECSPGGPLWARALVALVYVGVGLLCAYGAFTFFDGGVALSDWVFGAMAVGLALVALLGVKESLFPSRWTPE